MKIGEKLQVFDLYESIKFVQDESTRHILYIQLIQKYFPEAYEVLK